MKLQKKLINGLPFTAANGYVVNLGKAKKHEDKIRDSSVIFYEDGLRAAHILKSTTKDTEHNIVELESGQITLAELQRGVGVIVLTAIYNASDVYRDFNGKHTMTPDRWAELNAMSKGERAKEPDVAQYTALNKDLLSYQVTFASRLNKYGTPDPSIVKAHRAASSHGNAGKKRTPKTPAAPNAKGTNSPKGDTKPGRVQDATPEQHVLAICEQLREQFREMEAPSQEFRDVFDAATHLIDTGIVSDPAAK